MADDFELLRQRIRSAPLAEPPDPWIKLGHFAIGGITEIGFAEESEMLLVISTHARELIDCRAGRLVARDTAAEHSSGWYGHHDLIGRGFGPLSGRQISLAGVVGGGLLSLTRDGWGAVRLPIDWPEEYLLLISPHSSIYNPDAPFWKIAVTREPIAWGFSHTGDSLVAATEQGVALFGRSAN